MHATNEHGIFDDMGDDIGHQWTQLNECYQVALNGR
jgi:hypothetical protein